MNKQLFPQTITIDGPAASGKTTVGLMLSLHLEYLFLDTGCMYRAVTLAALDDQIPVEDEIGITRLTQRLEMDILAAGEHTDGRHYTVLVNGVDVTWDLRKESVDVNVSQVSTYAGVRRDLVRRQRAIGERGRVVMVGRDIGTVVLPDAPLKIYVTAEPEERARRRWKELEGRLRNASYEQILSEIQRRDEIDSGRDLAPMRPAADAIIIDSTNRTPEEVLQDILALAPFQSVS